MFDPDPRLLAEVISFILNRFSNQASICTLSLDPLKTVMYDSRRVRRMTSSNPLRPLVVLLERRRLFIRSKKYSFVI